MSLRYNLEALSPEAFQELAQALIVKEFPGVQCMPVGMPDGGRDAMVRPSRGRNDGVVFQVKFVRTSERDDVADWLESISDREAKNIEKLKKKGYTKYIVVTNARGTSHDDVGTIDRVNGVLDQFKIKAYCWWRDDIERRLDDAWNVKWSYPDIITGSDIVRGLLESRGGRASTSSSSNAIRAFVAAQFEAEREVRFRQVELRSDIFNLFVDIPLQIRAPRGPDEPEREDFTRARVLLERVALGVALGGETTSIQTWPEDTEHVLAANFLLDPRAAEITKLVLEGAPGQGKSTVTQFVCQVLRCRLLGKHVPSPFCDELPRGPVRVPIRVDLRDFAAWLSGANPFVDQAEAEKVPSKYRNLESFLTAFVETCSGGHDFSREKLSSLIEEMPVLLVLDGLDEVADTGQRRKVVDEIQLGVERLSQSAVNLQTIVTSRPAGFSSSPGMDENTFIYFSLGQIPPNIAIAYSKRWCAARAMNKAEALGISKVLEQRMRDEHVAQLSRNAMQLSILLSLISVRGMSLPDKRTNLYDEYVSLFFNREAEKSPTVLAFREALIDFHQHLAWQLHCEAEVGKSHGRITADALRRALRDYLLLHRYDAAMLDELFQGIVERVVAIVSRVDGYYEFEVQPLREYFAAKWLYNTAPYSPVGAEKKGTKPDRLAAVSRSPYWMNVARFYAGCFSKGELPAIVGVVRDLIEEKDMLRVCHPRLLAMAFLSDWVMAQSPRSTVELVGAIADDAGLNMISALEASSILPFGALSDRAGGVELRARCREVVRRLPPADTLNGLARLMRNPDTRIADDSLRTWWREAPSTTRMDANLRGRWLYAGVVFGLLEEVKLDELPAWAPLDDALQVEAVLRARRYEYVTRSPEVEAKVINLCLDNVFDTSSRGTKFELFDFLAMVNPYRYAVGAADRGTLRDRWNRGFAGDATGPFAKSACTSELRQQCVALTKTAEELASQPISTWRDASPWVQFVEHGRQLFGDRYRFALFAMHAAGNVKSSPKEPWDPSQGLVKQTLSVRHFGNHLPTMERLAEYAASSDGARRDWALGCIFAFATDEVVHALYPTLRSSLERADEGVTTRLLAMLDGATLGSSSESRVSARPSPLSELAAGPRMALLLLRRVPLVRCGQLLQECARSERDLQGDSAVQIYRTVTGRLRIGISVRSELEFMSRVYSRQVGFIRGFSFAAGEMKMKVKAAEFILDSPFEFPPFLVGAAETLIRTAAFAEIRSMTETAQSEGWDEVDS